MRTAIAMLILGGLVLAGSGGARGELTTAHIPSDTELLELLSDTLFAGEGRIGDRGGAETFELDLGASTASPATTAQYDWQSGVVEPFEIAYNSTTGLVTFSLGGITLDYTTPYSDFDVIIVRTRAVNDMTDVVVTDLVLDSESVGDLSSAAGPGGLDILMISGGLLNDGFTLSGSAVLTWTGTPPPQSRLAFQVKVARLAPVGVEESSWGAIKSLYR